MVGSEEDVILFRDGVMIDRLGAGLHVFWKGTGKVTWKAIDRREPLFYGMLLLLEFGCLGVFTAPPLPPPPP